MCAWDQHLLNLMHSTAKHISCKRKGTLAEGKLHCKFVFRTKVRLKGGSRMPSTLARLKEAAPSFEYRKQVDDARLDHRCAPATSDGATAPLFTKPDMDTLVRDEQPQRE
jgi:hypothetical protein